MPLDSTHSHSLISLLLFSPSASSISVLSSSFSCLRSAVRVTQTFPGTGLCFLLQTVLGHSLQYPGVMLPLQPASECFRLLQAAGIDHGCHVPPHYKSVILARSMFASFSVFLECVGTIFVCLCLRGCCVHVCVAGSQYWVVAEKCVLALVRSSYPACTTP